MRQMSIKYNRIFTLHNQIWSLRASLTTKQYEQAQDLILSSGLTDISNMQCQRLSRLANFIKK